MTSHMAQDADSVTGFQPLTPDEAIANCEQVLTKLRPNILRSRMLTAIEDDPFHSYVRDRFGRKVLTANLIFDDATKEIKELMLDLAREAAEAGNQMAKELFHDIADNYVKCHAPRQTASLDADVESLSTTAN